MTRKLVILPEAKRDLRQAIEWYERESEGLGYRFLDAVDHKFDAVLRNPEIHTIVHRQGRLVQVLPYPYQIVYSVTADQLVVFAVIHTSRDSSSWQNRLP